jgi:hypothetical protein
MGHDRRNREVRVGLGFGAPSYTLTDIRLGLYIHHVTIYIACIGVLIVAFYKSIVDYKVCCVRV